MNKEEYMSLYKTPEWQKKKSLILVRDNFTCKECGATDKMLHVHHIRYLEDKKPWEYPDYMLVTLCEECHAKFHDSIYKGKPNIDRNENEIHIPSSTSTRKIGTWKPDETSDAKIQYMPDNEKHAYYVISGKENLGCHATYYYEGKFYQAIGDLPQDGLCSILIALSSGCGKNIRLIEKTPEIVTVAQLRAYLSKKQSDRFKVDTTGNPPDFPFTKYRVIYKENPEERRFPKASEHLQLSTIKEIIEWIYEDLRPPYCTNRVYEKDIQVILKNRKYAREEILKYFEGEEYTCCNAKFTDKNGSHWIIPHASTTSICDENLINKENIHILRQQPIDKIEFKYYTAYQHKQNWQKHPELKTFGEYIDSILDAKGLSSCQQDCS